MASCWTKISTCVYTYIGETGAHAHVGPPRGARPAARGALGRASPRPTTERPWPVPTDPIGRACERALEPYCRADADGDSYWARSARRRVRAHHGRGGPCGRCGRRLGPARRATRCSSTGRGQGWRTMLESVAERSAVEPVRMAMMASHSAAQGRDSRGARHAGSTRPGRAACRWVHAAASPRPTATPARERAMAT